MSSKNRAVRFSDNVLDLPQQTGRRTTLPPLKTNSGPRVNANLADSQRCSTPFRAHLNVNNARLRSHPALLAITFITNTKITRSQRIADEQARQRKLQDFIEKLQVLIFITLSLVISKAYRNHFADASPSDTPPHQRPVRVHFDLKVEIWGFEIDIGHFLLLLLVVRRQVRAAARHNESQINGDGNVVNMNINRTTQFIYNRYSGGDGRSGVRIASTEETTDSTRVSVETPSQ
ncbi:hypothetical protein BJ166DRAFT_25121 [Pestalotiopsis sp. NC0098]|nr:hypothetical protein BJ166DRAFT_25121 [Pestalotiopsis sp. NC0098]